MEEEICYSTVVFKPGHQPEKETKEEPTIYSEVKSKGPAPAPAPAPAPVPAPAPAPAAAAAAKNGEAAACTHFCVLAVVLAFLCVILVVSIIFIAVIMNEQKANNSELTVSNQQLIVEMETLLREKEVVSRDRDNLNWTLAFILKFDTFPVNDFCPEKKCQPCQEGWILFQEKCYLFYINNAPWMTWKDSRKYCQSKVADLVVIDGPEEQEFISNNSIYYYDKFHGYWMGLEIGADNNWTWVDGRIDTLGYWIDDGGLGESGKYALMIPKKVPTASWDPANNRMLNRFICENDVLIRST